MLDAASRRTLPRCSACLLVSYRPLASILPNVQRQAKQGRDAALIGAGKSSEHLLKRSAQ